MKIKPKMISYYYIVICISQIHLLVKQEFIMKNQNLTFNNIVEYNQKKKKSTI